MNDQTHFKFYRYDPSFSAALVCAIAFLLTTTIHSYQLLRTRTWYFLAFVVGGTCKFLYLAVAVIESP